MVEKEELIKALEVSGDSNSERAELEIRVSNMVVEWLAITVVTLCQ